MLRMFCLLSLSNKRMVETRRLPRAPELIFSHAAVSMDQPQGPRAALQGFPAKRFQVFGGCDIWWLKKKKCSRNEKNCILVKEQCKAATDSKKHAHPSQLSQETWATSSIKCTALAEHAGSSWEAEHGMAETRWSERYRTSDGCWTAFELSGMLSLQSNSLGRTILNQTRRTRSGLCLGCGSRGLGSHSWWLSRRVSSSWISSCSNYTDLVLSAQYTPAPLSLSANNMESFSW